MKIQDDNENYRQLCFKCMRPVSSCYCKYTAPINCGIKFVFLMHPKEAKKQRTGTGRLASLCLPESEILMGIDFTKNKRLEELLNDPQYYPVLLYPSPDAWTCSKEGFKETIQGKKLLAIIVDSTWFCSKKILRYSTNINSLPKFSFTGNYKSIFTFKHEPQEYCVSTIETCYYLIKELQSTGIVDKGISPEPLMTVFKQMIKFQLQKENDRIEGKIPNSHAKDWKYTRKKEIPNF
ncbi:tRNA-uridine aminocarboxypropyltransferase [uncultured Treponema sp.]|uniref:tRNA-uridine aminocarboxypropyltransferase n=1 Tax=Treponema sp. TaxID=166 RepID=UPI0025DA2C69|nr:tRNA-uridine aminocarboxypropyltransferase [uncultured Treponema sp.]